MERLLKLASVLVCLSLIALCGCGGVTASSSGSNGNGGNSGSLGSSLTSIDFGQVTIGTTGTQTVTVTNSSSAAITVSQVTVTGTGFSSSPITTPFTLNPSQSASATFSFSPTSAGAATGSVSIVSNASPATLSIPMSGTGVAAGTQKLTASPSSLAFGNVSLGASNDISVTLRNPGTTNLLVNSASYSGPGFNVTGLSAPLTLSGGQATSFTASFGPSSVGSASGSISLKDNSGNTLLSIPMSGTGVTAAVAHSVDLSWTASTSTVSGYHVYRGNVTGGPYTLLTSSLVPSTSFADNSVTSGSSYFYVVTAVDVSNNESAFSNQAAATIPTP